MANRSLLSKFFIAGTSFAGGMALGLLLSSGNRKWLNEQIAEMGSWFNQYGNQHLENIKQHVRKGIDKNMPDLYEATEHIDFHDSDFLNA